MPNSKQTKALRAWYGPFLLLFFLALNFALFDFFLHFSLVELGQIKWPRWPAFKFYSRDPWWEYWQFQQSAFKPKATSIMSKNSEVIILGDCLLHGFSLQESFEDQWIRTQKHTQGNASATQVPMSAWGFASRASKQSGYLASYPRQIFELSAQSLAGHFSKVFNYTEIGAVPALYQQILAKSAASWKGKKLLISVGVLVFQKDYDELNAALLEYASPHLLGVPSPPPANSLSMLGDFKKFSQSLRFFYERSFSEVNRFLLQNGSPQELEQIQSPYFQTARFLSDNEQSISHWNEFFERWPNELKLSFPQALGVLAQWFLENTSLIQFKKSLQFVFWPSTHPDFKLNFLPRIFYNTKAEMNPQSKAVQSLFQLIHQAALYKIDLKISLFPVPWNELPVKSQKALILIEKNLRDYLVLEGYSANNLLFSKYEPNDFDQDFYLKPGAFRRHLQELGQWAVSP